MRPKAVDDLAFLVELVDRDRALFHGRRACRKKVGIVVRAAVSYAVEKIAVFYGRVDRHHIGQHDADDQSDREDDHCGDVDLEREFVALCSIRDRS